MRRAATLLMALGLSACAHHLPKPPPPPTKVEIPVPVSCIPKSYQPLALPFTVAQILQADGPHRYLMVEADRIAFEQHEKSVQALEAACK